MAAFRGPAWPLFVAKFLSLERKKKGGGCRINSVQSLRLRFAGGHAIGSKANVGTSK
jgi:hypothetical protein